ncbi:hypothetical protein LINGRAHAP2_LOCUS27766 [Linum grandiflorum]
MEELGDEGWEDMAFIYSNPPIRSPTEATTGDGAMVEDHLHYWDLDLNMEAEVDDDESGHGAMDCGDFDLNIVAELDDEDLPPQPPTIAAGISLRSSFKIISATTGGVENVGCKKVDHRNHLARIRQRQMIRGEATVITEYFRDKSRLCPRFWYKVEVDEKENIANIFWAD